jgi:exocyst complex component 4
LPDFERLTDGWSIDLTAREHVEVPPTPKGAETPAPRSPLKVSAMWADSPDIFNCMVELRDIPVNLIISDCTCTCPNLNLTIRCLQVEERAQIEQALKRETKIELDKKGNGELSADDLLSPSKKLIALGTLYSSLVRLGIQPLFYL